jgi:hypothetical protein
MNMRNKKKSLLKNISMNVKGFEKICFALKVFKIEFSS